MLFHRRGLQRRAGRQVLLDATNKVLYSTPDTSMHRTGVSSGMGFPELCIEQDHADILISFVGATMRKLKKTDAGRDTVQSEFLRLKAFCEVMSLNVLVRAQLADRDCNDVGTQDLWESTRVLCGRLLIHCRSDINTHTDSATWMHHACMLENHEQHAGRVMVGEWLCSGCRLCELCEHQDVPEAAGIVDTHRCVFCRSAVGNTVQCPFCLHWWHDSCANDFCNHICSGTDFIGEFTKINAVMLASLREHRVPSPCNCDWWGLLSSSELLSSSAAASSSSAAAPSRQSAAQ